MSEGLFGHALDLRVIATTNTPIEKLDPAVVRGGRMLAHLHFLPMRRADAEHCLWSLLPGTEFAPDQIKDSMSLADVYQVARAHGWAPVEPEEVEPEEDEDE
jgi:hypothetical protein